MAEDFQGECIECGGYGTEEGCSECGKKLGTLDLATMSAPQMQKFLHTAATLDIPEHYRGIEWTQQTFWRTKPEDLQKDQNLVKYLTQLEKVQDMYSRGLVPSKSLVVEAPHTFGKITWAYSCMQLAIQAGHSVAPLLDTVEAKRLLVLAGENPNYKLYNKIDYDSWLMSTVMFVTVTKTEYAKEASFIMRELLDRRSRKGLGTNFLTEYGMDVLTSKDRTGAFQRHKFINGRVDDLKFPYLIRYVEYFKNSRPMGVF